MILTNTEWEMVVDAVANVEEDSDEENEQYADLLLKLLSEHFNAEVRISDSYS